MAQTRVRNASAFLIISAFALCVVLPFLKLGIPSGHDFEFHVNSWIEITEHWRQNNFFPHWAALAHYGYGEARFIFYPPFSWTFGALLGEVLPWKLVPAAYIWSVLTFAGWSMFLLARRWLSYRNSIAAAIFYTLNPYHLVVVYWRSAMAELMASIYLPLLLLLILRAEENPRRTLVPLSALLAAAWLTNLPSAVIINYSVAALALVIALRRQSFEPLAYVAGAVLLGATLAGFYLVPAFHERSWVDIAQVLAPGVRPMDNFLFTRTTDADHNRFNLLVSIVAAVEIAITVGALTIWRSRWSATITNALEHPGSSRTNDDQTNNDRRLATLWSLLLTWSVLCTLMMLRPSLPLWIHLPELRFVQLPWRLLLCLSVSFALAIVFCFRRWWLQAMFWALALAAIVIVWQRVQAPWWDNAADIKEMLDNEHDGIGNEGIDEYVPAGADPYDIDQNAPLVRFAGDGDARISVEELQSEHRRLNVDASAPGNLVLRLFNYPSWSVWLNGVEVKTGATPHTRQMIIPIDAGHSEIEIRFVPGWDRMIGIVCTGIAGIVLLLWFALSRREDVSFS